MSVFIPDILESFLGDIRKHNETSGQIAFDCPACSEDKGLHGGDGKGNLEVNYKRGVFKCWACGDENHMHGGIPKLIFKYGSNEILRRYNELKPDDGYGHQTNTELAQVAVTLPENYKKLSDTPDGYIGKDDAMDYLKGRGITNDMIADFDIGYCMSGKFFGRIIIPSYGADEALNYFIARTFKKRVFPPYKNPTVEKQLIIFNEKRVNLDSTIYLVEGAFDHIVVPNSIPLLGKIISDKLMEFLYKANANIVILLDADARKDAVRHYRKLNVGRLEGKIRICTPPLDHDPSSIFQALGYDGIRKLLRNYTMIPSESRLGSVIT